MQAWRGASQAPQGRTIPLPEAALYSNIARDRLPAPAPTEEDLALRSEAELKARGIRRLPTSLVEALAAFEADAVAASWWPPLLLDLYVRHKRGEIALLDGLSEEEQARRYALVY